MPFATMPKTLFFTAVFPKNSGIYSILTYCTKEVEQENLSQASTSVHAFRDHAQNTGSKYSPTNWALLRYPASKKPST